MKRATTIVTAIALTALIVPAAAAQADTGASPDPVVPDEQAVHELVSQAADHAAASRAGTTGLEALAPAADPAPVLDQALEDLVQDGAVAVTARVERPGLHWRGSDGARERGDRPRTHPQDQFRVASNTKMMVATLVMQEVERGTWTLDSTVGEVLPGVLPEHPEVSIEQLLSHRSGLQTGTGALLASRMSDPTSIDELFEVLGQDYADAEQVAIASALPWLFEPGTGFGYSNAGYVLLGMMLQEVTGSDVATLLQEGVFDPAGMRHSSYPDEPGHRGPFLMGAAYTGDHGAGWYDLDGFDPDVFSSAGAVVSTTEDLVYPALVQQMLTPRSTEIMEYGLGTYRIPDPCAEPGEEPQWLYGHDGAAFGTLSVAFTPRMVSARSRSA